MLHLLAWMLAVAADVTSEHVEEFDDLRDRPLKNWLEAAGVHERAAANLLPILAEEGVMSVEGLTALVALPRFAELKIAALTEKKIRDALAGVAASPTLAVPATPAAAASAASAAAVSSPAAASSTPAASAESIPMLSHAELTHELPSRNAGIKWTHGARHRPMNGAAAYGLSNAGLRGHDPMALLRGTSVFEFYTWPVVTRFGDVHNVAYNDMPLPLEIAQRLAGRTIAIRGVEGDWVTTDINTLVNASTPRRAEAALAMTNTPAGPNERVPPSSMYNHHMKFLFPDAKADNVEEWLFSEGNGGEMRASFKGFPSGTGLIVHSPSKISINLMAIDIDERKRIDIGGSSASEDGPESQPAVLSARQAAMIECPCTRTLTKPLPPPTCAAMLNDAHMNPWIRKGVSCDPKLYQAGGRCGTDGAVLLEPNETQPIGLIARRFRMRIYYDAYTPPTPADPYASHEHLSKMTMTPEGKAIEYAVPACSKAAKLRDPSCFGAPSLRPVTSAACVWPPVALPEQDAKEMREDAQGYAAYSKGYRDGQQGKPYDPIADVPDPVATLPVSNMDGCSFVLHFQTQIRLTLDLPPWCLEAHYPGGNKDRMAILAGKASVGLNASVSLVYAIPHCHAPSCKLVELYDADDNLLCRVTPKYNHADYIIRIDPCVWGSPEEGLPPRPVLPLFGPKSLLKMVKVNQNRLGRPLNGEMGSWQIRAVLHPDSSHYKPDFTKGWHAWGQ